MMHVFEILIFFVFVLMCISSECEHPYQLVITCVVLILTYELLIFQPLVKYTTYMYDNNITLPHTISEVPQYIIENHVADKAIQKYNNNKDLNNE